MTIILNCFNYFENLNNLLYYRSFKAFANAEDFKSAYIVKRQLSLDFDKLNWTQFESFSSFIQLHHSRMKLEIYLSAYGSYILYENVRNNKF